MRSSTESVGNGDECGFLIESASNLTYTGKLESRSRSVHTLCLGLGTSWVSHETWMLRPENTPMTRKQTPVYRTPMLSEVMSMMVPTAERQIGPIYNVSEVFCSHG